MTEKEQSIIQVSEQFKLATKRYLEQNAVNERELNIRKNDLSVYQAMMKLTACPSPPTADTAFAQTRRRPRMCRRKSRDDQGLWHLNFGDGEMQRKLERMMTP